MLRRPDKSRDSSRQLNRRGLTEWRLRTDGAEEIGEIQIDLAVGLLVKTIIKEELGMPNPVTGTIVCHKEADPRFSHPLVLKVEDEDGSDLTVRQLDILVAFSSTYWQVSPYKTSHTREGRLPG